MNKSETTGPTFTNPSTQTIADLKNQLWTKKRLLFPLIRECLHDQKLLQLPNQYLKTPESCLTIQKCASVR